MPKSPNKLFETVYNDNIRKLYKFFYYKVLNQQIAEDLTSETFLKLAEKLSAEENNIEKIENYLYGIARNTWNMYLRDKYKQPEYYPEDIDSFTDFVAQEVEAIESIPLHNRALVFIDKLPNKQREIAHMRLIQGMTPTEIADKMNKPTNHVKVTLRRSMRRLEELIAVSKVSDTERTLV